MVYAIQELFYILNSSISYPVFVACYFIIYPFIIFPLPHNGFYAILIINFILEVIGLQNNTIKVNDEFAEIDTRTIDGRNRLTIGELAHGFNRVRLYKNKMGEILLKPVVEIPVSELWLFQNKEALENVQKGLKDLSEEKIKNTQTIMKKIISILKKNNASMIKVFGSFARGDFDNTSDIDLIVDFSDRKSLIDLARIEDELKTETGFNIDLLTKNSLSPYIIDRVNSEAKVVYEKSR